MEYVKVCPSCGKDQHYKYKHTYLKALAKDSICTSCAQKRASTLKPQCQKGFKNEKLQGQNNPMFGKTFMDVWRQKYDEEIVQKLIREHAEKSKHVGENNGMHGKTVLECLITKYGKEEALKRWEEQNLKKANKGSKNGSYGKPAYPKAGRGIKGWLYDIFFRSLLEMQYIYFCHSQGHTLSSAEKLEYRIDYKNEKDQIKTYHPDFILNDYYIVEIKPDNLVQYNKCKIDAAKEHYKDRFKVETNQTFPYLMNDAILEDLYNTKQIRFVDIDIVEVKRKLKRYYRNKQNESN